MSIFEGLTEIARQYFSYDGEINMETRLAEDLGADSLDTVELVTEVEDKFEIEIPDENLVGIKTIGEFVNIINNLLVKK